MSHIDSFTLHCSTCPYWVRDTICFTVSSPYLGTFPYKIRSVVFWSISWPSLWSTTKTTGILHQCSQLRALGICLACQHHSNIHREEWFLADRKKIFGTFQTFDPYLFLFGELDDWWLMPWFLGLMLKMICWFFGEGYCLPLISKSFGVEKGGVHVALGYSDELCGATVFENTWSTGTCSLSPAALLVPWW